MERANRALRIVESLSENSNINIEPYLHQLLPVVLSFTLRYDIESEQ